MTVSLSNKNHIEQFSPSNGAEQKGLVNILPTVIDLPESNKNYKLTVTWLNQQNGILKGSLGALS